MKSRVVRLSVPATIALLLGLPAVALAQQQPAAPPPKTWRHFPQPPRAPQGAPNVLLIMTDDVGFASTSVFGGPIPTPVFAALAASGLRYNAFHTTAMCSPTRAALLTGRNTHAVASGSITNVAVDEPGYTSVIPRSAATAGRVLRDAGYDTAFFGKNHNTPVWETGPMGPFDRWPTGLGFDYFYGFNSAAEDQFRPQLVENRNLVDPPADPDYVFDRDMTDKVLQWLRTQRSQSAGKPFFVYLAPGSMHSPHQAPADWIAKFAGRFDMGWDELRRQTYERQKALGIIPKDAALTPRPAALPAWNSLSAAAKRTYARQMEVAAAQLAFHDHQTGRIIEDLRAAGQLDDTLVIYLHGDNGASMDSRRGAVHELQSLLGIEPTEAELIATSAQHGTRHSYSNYNAAWAWAQNAPFPWGKQIASHLGGLRDGLVISWPRRIKAAGGLRTQFHHVIDIAPTIYEAAGVRPPTHVDGVAQQPLDGVSMVYSFDDAAAPSTRREQYFEMLGNRSFYRDGWLAATTPARAPFDRSREPVDPQNFAWELYDLRSDWSQSRNLAAREPQKLAELRAGFDDAARRFGVYPLAGDLIGRVGAGNRPSLLDGRTDVTYHAGDSRYPGGSFAGLAPGWQMIATFTTTEPAAEGPVVISGDEAGGAGLFVRDGRPTYIYNPTARDAERLTLTGETLAPGTHTVTVTVSRDPAAGERAARLHLLADGREVASANVPVFYAVRGTGVVGRYGVRTLLPELSNPPARGLTVEKVRFTQR